MSEVITGSDVASGSLLFISQRVFNKSLNFLLPPTLLWRMGRNSPLVEGPALRQPMFLRQAGLRPHVGRSGKGWAAAESAWENLKCTWKETGL